MNYIRDAALLKLLLKEILGIYHRNIGSRICLNNGDINEVLYPGFLRFVKQVEIALIIDVVVADSGRTFGKSYCSDNGICAVAHALECLGVRYIYLNESEARIDSDISLCHIKCNNFMTISDKFPEHIRAQVAIRARKNNLHINASHTCTGL